MLKNGSFLADNAMNGYDYEFKARWNHGTRFIINSAWQGGLPYSQNLTNTKFLRRAMKDELDLDILKITGKYAENLEEIECMVSFPSDDIDLEMLKRFFYYYGRKYKQNCIIFVDEHDTIWTLPTRPTSTFGMIGRMIKGKKFIYQKFPELVSKFLQRTYEMDRVKIPTD